MSNIKMSLDYLPDDIIYHIISMSDIQDIITLRYVNKKFNIIAKEVLSVRNPTTNDDEDLITVNINNLHNVLEEYYGNVLCDCSKNEYLLQSIDTQNINGFYFASSVNNDTLNYIPNAKYVYIECFSFITDISMLSNVTHLCVEGANISNVSMLTKVLYLYICKTKVEDVNMLTQLICLNISNTKIKDVSNLINLKELYASGTLIEDVSTLTNLNILRAENTRIKDVNMLINLTTLDIERTTIDDVSKLTNLINLDADFSKISNVNTLIKLEYLSICSTPVSDVSNLTNLTRLYITKTKFVNLVINNTHIIDDLDITYCPLLETISINKIESLYIENTPKLKYIDGNVKHLMKLKIMNCESIDYINVTNKTLMLTCENCIKLQYINVNNKLVDNIVIKNCPITNINDILRVHSLYLYKIHSNDNSVSISKCHYGRIIENLGSSPIKVKNKIMVETQVHTFDNINKLTLRVINDMLEIK